MIFDSFLLSLLRYFHYDYCRLEVTVAPLKLRHFVARQDDATYYGTLSPHKTPPLLGIERLPHGNAPRSPTPPPPHSGSHGNRLR